jgi:hypothetical protein
MRTPQYSQFIKQQKTAHISHLLAIFQILYIKVILKKIILTICDHVSMANVDHIVHTEPDCEINIDGRNNI